MLRSVVVAWVLLAVPAWGGDGPSEKKMEQDLAACAAEIAKLQRMMNEVSDTVALKVAELTRHIEAERQAWAKAEDAHRQRMKALEEARGQAPAQGKVAVARLTEQMLRREAELTALRTALAEKHRRAEGKAKPTSVEDKLDLILKKLDDLDQRVKKLEGKTQGTLYDGLRPK